MAATVQNFTTGPTTLPDVGELSYNGCKFSPLFATTMSGTVIKDAANRTTKLMEYVLEVDGYVTSPDVPAVDGISATVKNMETLLTAHAGALIYKGRGFNFSVNAAGAAIFDNSTRDVAWGPVPELLEFQPMGGGRSAKIRWRVTIRVVTGKATQRLIPKLGNAANVTPLLQFNYETSVSYGEDYYAKMSINGVMEIPMTRATQGDRVLKSTVDDAREQLNARIFAGINLDRFYIADRQYKISRDKRTLEFDIQIEEKPYMDQPPGCSIARGTFSFRPARAGMGLCLWMCTLRCTYTVRADAPRRVAWEAFLLLLRERMSAAAKGNVVDIGGNQNPARIGLGGQAVLNAAPLIGGIGGQLALPMLAGLLRQQQQKPDNNTNRPMLIDFSGDEGIYRDSKTTTFSASWRMVTTFSHILLASGLWRKTPEKDAQGKNEWAINMKDISGAQTWVNTQLNPAADVIVDFGS